MAAAALAVVDFGTTVAVEAEFDELVAVVVGASVVVESADVPSVPDAAGVVVLSVEVAVVVEDVV